MVNEIQKVSFSFEKIGKYIILFTIFLLPIFFLPINILSVSHSKIILLGISSILITICFLIDKIKKGSVSLPTNPFFYIIFFIPAVYAASSFFSVNRGSSLLGFGFETDTLHAVSLFCLFAFLVFQFLRTKKDIVLTLVLLFSSFVLITIFQTLRLFLGPTFLSLGAFQNTISSVVGNWSDLSILAGLMAGIILMALEMLSLGRIAKSILYVLFIPIFLFIAISNFGFNLYVISIPIYILLGACSLIVFSYIFSLRKSKKNKEGDKVPLAIPSLVIFVVSLLLMIFGGYINSKLTDYFGTYYSEGRPSWTASFYMASKVLSERPFLGAGPSTFDREWNLFKPNGFQNTDFWNTDFSFGVGYIPSALATTGILGFLSWLIFLGFIFYLSYKIIFAPSKDRLYSFLKSSIGFSALFLGLTSFFYVPGSLLIILMFLFSGLVFSIALNEGLIKENNFIFSGGHKLHFVFTLSSIILIILFVGFAYGISTNTIALIYANKSLSMSLNAASPEGIRSTIIKAISFDEKSLYYRLLAQADVALLSEIASKGKNEVAQRSQEIQNIVLESINASAKAEELDRGGFRSVLATGNILENLGILGIEDATDNAIKKYADATLLSPTSPLPAFFAARAESSRGNAKQASEYLGIALVLKPNFVDAYTLAAQIVLAQNNQEDAEKILERALSFDPLNYSLSYQIGTLKLDSKKYTEAIQFFRQALSANPNFANARYLLGISLFYVGQREEALKELNNVLESNPGNVTLEESIRKVRAGQNPLTNNQSAGISEEDKASTTTPKKTTR